MFTGIIENTAEVVEIDRNGTNLTFTLKSEVGLELKVDQSVAHNGVCLTVESVMHDVYSLTAIKETLDKTNLGQIKVGDLFNIERCMAANGRFDGHIVQGHVDGLAKLEQITDLQGSWELKFSIQPEFSNFIVEKGSICLNGVSLTIFEVQEAEFKVALIPYTWNHTNLSKTAVGDFVNVEFDILGKYIQRMLRK